MSESPALPREHGSETHSPSPLAEKVRSLQLPRQGSLSHSGSGSGAKWGWLAAGVAGFVLLGNALGWFSFAQQGTQQPRAAVEGEQTASGSSQGAASKVRSVSEARPAGDIALESNGYFVPARKILVSPKVSGMLLTSNLQEGRYFRKGEVLGVIESVDYAADVQRATASKTLAVERLRELQQGNREEEIDQVEAELAESEAMLEKTAADYRRATELIQRKSITPAEFDDAYANFTAQQRRVERLKAATKLIQIGAREERIAQAQAEVQQADAELTKARWRLENCEIRAPVSGTILTKNAEEGNVVNPVAMNGSYSLCEMADLSDLEVDLKIQERDVPRVFVGQQCRVRAIAWPDRQYEGVVDRLLPIADRSKGAVPIRVKVRVPAEEQGVYLKPEMGAIVTFLAAKGEEVAPTTKP